MRAPKFVLVACSLPLLAMTACQTSDPQLRGATRGAALGAAGGAAIGAVTGGDVVEGAAIGAAAGAAVGALTSKDRRYYSDRRGCYYREDGRRHYVDRSRC